MIVLVLFGLGYQPIVMANSCHGGKKDQSTSSGTHEHKVKDYVCGMKVELNEDTLEKEYKGITFYFDNEDCQKKFKEDKKSYFEKISADYNRFASSIFSEYFKIQKKLAGDSTQGLTESATVILDQAEILSRLKPEFKEAKAGKFQAVVKKVMAAVQPLTEVKYTCSMHPQIIKDEPGKCPICGGMKLIKKKVEIEAARQVFDRLSTALISYLKKVDQKEKHERIAYVYYCGMKKKSWLQNNKDVKNPYAGSKMLECGVLQE